MEDFFLVVAGGRDFTDYDLLKERLDYFLKDIKEKFNIVIVSGTCRGADKLGERYAEENRYKVLRFFPDWSLGKKAGPLRNEEMAKIANAAVVAWDNQSRGTKNMIDNAIKYHLPLRIIPY